MIKLVLAAAGMAAYVLLNLLSLQHFQKHPSKMRPPNKAACTALAVAASVIGVFVAAQGGLFACAMLVMFLLVLLRWNYLRIRLSREYAYAYSYVPTYRMEQAEKVYYRTLDWMPEVFMPCTVFGLIAEIFL